MPRTLATPDFGHDLWIDQMDSKGDLQLFTMDNFWWLMMLDKAEALMAVGFELIDYFDDSLAWLIDSPE